MCSICIMTYNVRGCRGVDGKIDPDRIRAVIEDAHPDIVALQDVSSTFSSNHLSYLAEHLGMEAFGGKTNAGNGFLSHYPLKGLEAYDLGSGGVCLKADADVFGKRLHLFNLCLRTFPFPPRKQILNLMGPDLLNNSGLVCPTLIMGDFADPWIGLGNLDFFLSFRRSFQLSWKPTFPSRFSIFPRDRFYFKGKIAVLSCMVLKNSITRKASSHLPLVMTLKIQDSLEYLKTERIRDNNMEAAPGCFRKRTES